MGSIYRQQLESWLSEIEVDVDNVLDVGGGQLPIQSRVKSFKAKKCLLLDNDSQYNPDIFHDLNTGNDIPEEYRGSFDVLFCLEVMEYVWNPVQAHQTLNNFLIPGGVAYISYPTLYPLHNPVGIDYLRYSKFAIEKLLHMTGFNDWEITPRVATDGRQALADFYSLERMRPTKGTMQVFDIGYLVKVIKT